MSKPWKTTYSAPADTRHRAGKRQHREAFVAQLEVSIDWAKLARILGAKATANSTGKSKLMGGVITVKSTTKAPAWRDVEA